MGERESLLLDALDALPGGTAGPALSKLWDAHSDRDTLADRGRGLGEGECDGLDTALDDVDLSGCCSARGGRSGRWLEEGMEMGRWVDREVTEVEVEIQQGRHHQIRRLCRCVCVCVCVWCRCASEGVEWAGIGGKRENKTQTDREKKCVGVCVRVSNIYTGERG